MKYKNNQRGISALGLMALLVIIGLTVLVGLKLFPIYMDSFKIDTALENVMADADIATRTKKQIAEALIKRLDIDNVEAVTYKNYRERVVVKKKGKKVTIDVVYRAEAPLFGNLSLVADFKKHAEN